MFLVDTNIISAIAPGRRNRSEELVDWLDSSSERLFLSVVTASEIRSGIYRAQRHGDPRAAMLRNWWETIEHLYGQRLLALDLAAANVAGKLIDRSRAYDVGFEDIAIAATAEVNGLTVLTDNERHFIPLGVAFINPLKELPPLRS